MYHPSPKKEQYEISRSSASEQHGNVQYLVERNIGRCARQQVVGRVSAYFVVRRANVAAVVAAQCSRGQCRARTSAQEGEEPHRHPDGSGAAETGVLVTGLVMTDTLPATASTRPERKNGGPHLRSVMSGGSFGEGAMNRID